MTSATTRTEPGALARLAGWSQRHHWLAILVWVAVLAGVTAGSQGVGATYHNDISLPGTESQRVLDALRSHAPAAAGEVIQIVLHDPDGLTDPSTRARVSGMLTAVRALPHVASVADPFAPGPTLSADRTTAYATVQMDQLAIDLPPQAVKDVIATARAGAGDGFQVELGGDAVRSAEGAGGGPAEGVGLLAALVVLLLMFGSLLAAVLPLITAVFAVGSSVGVVALVSRVATIPSYAASLMVLVGLGVGIDYALLVFSRFRAELLAGASRDQAGRTALDTAGRAVLFAGLIVMIALLGLLALGLASLQGVALSVALTVAVSMIASLTLLPSLLTIFGGRIERSIRIRAAKSRRPPGARWRVWDQWARRFRWPAILAALVLLIGLSAPVTQLHLGIADAGTDSPKRTSRAAYDLLAQGFGPGFNGALAVLATGADLDGARVQAVLGHTGGIAAVAPAQPLPDGSGALVFVIPTAAPQAAETSALVDRLRTDVLPAVSASTGATYLVGGTPAAVTDFSEAVASRLPYFILAVVGLSALLLMVVFGSILIPLKAAVFNILSISACLGVITLVFQHGWFGVQPGPIEAFVPVMIFAIVFGLSMDYEVFLVTRMHEDWRAHGDAARAITEGLATTGGVITAAASIMIVVFASFLLSPDRMLQQFGLGLAVAVLLDALVIRCLLVPTVMSLFGPRAWWLPTWLRRVLPRIALEPPSTPAAAADAIQGQQAGS